MVATRSRRCKVHGTRYFVRLLPYPKPLPCCFARVPVISPAQLVARVKKA